VTIEKSGRVVRVLSDAGLTPDGLVENMRRLEISARDIDVIVLSHGHWDHTTGMDGLVAELGRANVPVLTHPDFWSRRRVALPGPEAVELPSTSKNALERAGFEIVEQRQPSFLLDGSPLVTGEVDRDDRVRAGLPGPRGVPARALAAGPADPRRPGARCERARPGGWSC
jgi:7,8-dihydropterin-6-yl-methyl-4-(beta-D-ribofuranosyl)aminobenzene 5'-phosphate synthase